MRIITSGLGVIKAFGILFTEKPFPYTSFLVSPVERAACSFRVLIGFRNMLAEFSIDAYQCLRITSSTILKLSLIHI